MAKNRIQPAISVAPGGRVTKMTRSRSLGSLSSRKLPSSHWNPPMMPVARRAARWSSHPFMIARRPSVVPKRSTTSVAVTM